MIHGIMAMAALRPETGEGLELVGLEVAVGGRRRPTLCDVDVAVGPGKMVLICGRSGSGKSTLLKTVAGLIPWVEPGLIRGDLRLGGESIADLDPGQRAHLLATCLDRPEHQLFLPRPEDEIRAAALRHHTPDALRDEVVAGLGIAELLDRRVADLSSGERQRVALATTLLAGERPLLLDEPTAHLDADGVVAAVTLLERRLANGASALVADHSGWRWQGLPMEVYGLDQDGVVPADALEPPKLPRPGHDPGHATVLEAFNLLVGRDGRPVAGPLDLSVRVGEVVVLTGANGAGKSTLARTLCGWLRPLNGRIRHRAGPPRLMLPEADLQLFASSVQGELDGRGLTSGEIARVLRRHRLEHLAARAPWTLSRGEQQRLVHASWDVGRPDLLVVDEPAQGLDGVDLQMLIRLIHRRAERGRGYLIITHRRELAAAAHRHLHLGEGRLVEVRP